MPFPIGIAGQDKSTDAQDNPYACMQCGRHLTPDEIGLYKKMVNRGSRPILSNDRMAANYGTTVAAMEERIAHFRATGCSLFH